MGRGGGSASGVRGVGAESAGFAGGRLCMIMGETGAVLGSVPHAQSSGNGTESNCVGRQSNPCLQQMVTVVTVRAEHGPRQPRPLLKQVVRLKGAKEQGIGFKRRFWLAYPCFPGRRCARSRLAHSSSLGAALAFRHGSTVPVAGRCSDVPSLSRVLRVSRAISPSRSSLLRSA